MERKAYLINRSFRYYMVAAMMTMAAMNLNSILDGILMGHLLGAEALSAINAVIPIVSLIGAVGTLLAQGPAIRIAKYLGSMDNDRANQVFTVSITSMLAVCLSLSVLVLIYNLSPPVIRFLHVAEELVGMAEKYTAITMLGCTLLIFQNGLAVLVDVMGKPKVVTLGMTLGTVANIVFDILSVKCLGMDISGAAYATLLGALVSDAILLNYIFRHSGFKLRRSPKFFSDFFIGVANSLPGLVGTLSFISFMLVCNYFVMAAQGAAGMFVLSIGYAVISVGSMISNGVGMSYMAIGGMMLGQGDNQGVKILFVRGMFVTLLAPVCFSVLSLFSHQLALLFGADSPALFEMTERALPLVCTLLFSLGTISSMVFLHVTLGHRVLAAVNSLTVLASVIVSFGALNHALPPEKIWLAFPLATVLSLVIFLADTMAVSLSKGLQPVSLIPKSDSDRKLLDISVECKMETVSESIAPLIDFLHENGADDLTDRILHCLEELMINIVEHSGRGAGSYMDLSVLILDEKVTAYLRNDGRPFDPLQVEKDDRKIGLTLTFHYCSRLEYRYSFGQNIVLLTWDRTTK